MKRYDVYLHGVLRWHNVSEREMEVICRRLEDQFYTEKYEMEVTVKPICYETNKIRH